MKKKTPTGAAIPEAGPDKSHIESCKNPVWNAGQRDRAGRVGESDPLFVFRTNNINTGSLVAGRSPY